MVQGEGGEAHEGRRVAHEGEHVVQRRKRMDDRAFAAFLPRLAPDDQIGQRVAEKDHEKERENGPSEDAPGNRERAPEEVRPCGEGCGPVEQQPRKPVSVEKHLPELPARVPDAYVHEDAHAQGDDPDRRRGDDQRVGVAHRRNPERAEKIFRSEDAAVEQTEKTG